MKKLIFGIIATVMFTNLSFGQTIEDCNKQLNLFKETFKVDSNATIIIKDNSKPINLSIYLSQMGLEKSKINLISHLQIDTKTQLGLVDSYSIQYSDDSTKNLLVLVNPKNNDDYILLNTNFDLVKNTVNIIGKRGSGPSKWSQCFGDCVNAGLDAHGLLGQVIITAGVAGGFGCVPCGFVASAYAAVLIVGCAGGCNH